ncbi:A/G-specific adenine glycosylase [Opitutus sp. GAS368]|uniref:A/G-specific adenine glycosylase n=1 Tax=Opitutus sp. GAS368 TaxID=1882749 RepID=UPI00087CB771|nr:A/G-specific adenine glycosylase [Opitutus sp. GAS368]SDR70145.1 A/G-specific DNA-adenine glycosylase [Opitutus sp. GAS368]
MANSENLIARRAGFQTALHAWYRAHHRKLPWRDTPSLYKTVVSEFMLQQTQVATVLPYFNRWLRELPDFVALAAAPETKVMKLWEGLGYYSRARNLHKLAQAYIAAPAKPRTPAEWRELPGIGPYTAAAITSISFGEPAAVVDGNVVRILARLVGEGRLFRDGTEAVKHFTPLADALVIGSNPGEHNQAMMELGATVCLRANPMCLVCPVAGFCAARAAGTPDKFPRLKPKVIEQKAVARVWCEHHGRLLLRLGHAKAKRLAGLHELPETSDLGIKPGAKSLLAVKRRTITRFAITESIYVVKPTAALLKRIARDAALEWVPLKQLDQVTLSGPHKRWIGDLLDGRG